MANNKEEIIFKVKAELAGFKKSMEELKKMAKESSKSIEKMMNLDLTDEGSKAGKSFAKGMNKEIKTLTDNLQKELKLMSQKTYTIKVKLDASDIERVKRELTGMEIRVSASASGRASSSMSNNANAPNGLNTMASAVNSAALGNNTAAINRSTNAIMSAERSIVSTGNAMKTTGDSVKSVGDKLIIASNSMNATSDKVMSAGNSIKRAGSQIETANRILKSATDKMNTISTNASEAGRMMRYTANVIRDSLRMVKAAGDKFKEAGKRVTDAGNKVSGLGARVERAANKISQSASNVKVNTPSNVTINGDDIKDASIHIKDASDNMNNAGDKIRDAGTKVDNAGSKVQSAGAKVDSAGNKIDKASGKIESAGTKIRTSGNSIESAGQKIESAATTIKQIATAVDKMVTASVDIDSASINIRDAATDMGFTGADIRKASENMGFTSKDIRDAASDLRDAGTDIGSVNLDSAADDIRSAGTVIGDAALDLRYAATDVKDAVSNIKVTVDVPDIQTGSIDVNIDSAVGDIEEASKKMDEAGDKIKSAASTFESATTNALAANMAISTNVAEMAKIAQTIGSKMNQAFANVPDVIAVQQNIPDKITVEADDTVKNIPETITVEADEELKNIPDVITVEAGEELKNIINLISTQITNAFDDSIKKIGPAITNAFNESIEKLKAVKVGIQDTVSASTNSSMINFGGFGALNKGTSNDINNLKELNKQLEDAADEIKLIRSITTLKGKGFIHGLLGEENADMFDNVDLNLSSLTAQLQTQLAKLKSLIGDFNIDDILKVDANKLNLPALDAYIKAYTKLKGEIEGCKRASDQLQYIADKYGSLTEYVEIFIKTAGEKIRFDVANPKDLTNGFDELSMTVEDADEAVTKLRMNLKLLSRDFDLDEIFNLFRNAVNQGFDNETFNQYRKALSENFSESLKDRSISGAGNRIKDAFSRTNADFDLDKVRARNKEINYRHFDRIKYIIDDLMNGKEVSDRMLDHAIDVANNRARATALLNERKDAYDSAKSFKDELEALLDSDEILEAGYETYEAIYQAFKMAETECQFARKQLQEASADARKVMDESWADFESWIKENYSIDLPAIRYNTDLPAIYKDLRKQLEPIEDIEVEYIAVGPEDVVHAIEKIEEAKKRIQNIIEVDFTVIDMDEITGEMEQVKRICDSTFKSIGFDETKLIAPLNVVKSSLGTLEASVERVGEEFEFVFETVRANSRKALGNAVIEDVPYRFIEDLPVTVNTRRSSNTDNTDDINRGTQAFRDASGEVNSILQAILNALKRLGMVAGNVFAGIGAAILKAFDSNPIGRIRAWAASIRDSVDVEEVEQARNTLRKFINDIRKEFPKLDNLAQRVKKSFSDMFNTVKRLMNPFSLLGASVRKVTGYFRNMGNEASGASGKVDKLTGSVKGLLGKLSMFFGIYELFGWMKEGTQDAMKYEATIMNLQRTLGVASKSVIDFANTQAVAFGLSKRQVAEYGNIFSVIMNEANAAMAKAGDTMDDVAAKTANMSQGLLEAAGIIAGATGYNVEEVLEGLRSGILGSSEAVDQYGLNLKVANLEQSKTFKEVANGATSWNQLTTAQQQYIIAQEIINQTTAKYGGIIKNTASLHNQFLAQLANTKLALGNLGKVIWTAILPALTKLLAYLEVIFNYAASALTALLALFNIKVDFSNSAGTDALQSSLGSMEDTATDTSGALDSVGDSSEESAKKTEESAKKIKRALAGFDQINVLALGQDEEDTPLDEPIDLGEVTPVDPGDFGVQLPDLTPQTQENLQKFKDFIDKIKALLKELAEPFKAAWDELGFRWIQAWNRLKESFRNFCDSLGKFLKAVWDNGGKEFVQHMAEIALAVGIAAMEIGGTILNSLAKLWEHLNPENNGHTQAFLDALNEVSQKVRDLLLDLNNHFESLMLHGGQEVLNAFGDMLMDLGTAATRAFGVIIDAIDGLLDHLDPLNNEITRNMLAAWEYAFTSIGDAALAFADLLESALVNGGQAIVNSLGDLAVQIAATMGVIVGEVADSAAELFRHMDPATNKYSAGALEGFRYFIDSIRGFVEMLGEAFSLFMENGGQEFVNNMGDIVAILIDLGATIAGDLISAITNFFNSWAGQIVIEAAARALELFSSILKGLLEILEHFSPILSGVVAGFLAFMGIGKVVSTISTLVTIFQTAGGVIGIVKTALTALWGVMMLNPVAAVVAAVVALGVAFVALYNKCDGFREAVQGIMDAFSGLFEAIKGALSNILDDITNIFQDVIDIIVGIFTGDGQRVGEAVRNLVTHILQLLGDLVLGAIDIGVNLITGLIKGIWEGIKLIPEAITGVVNFIKDFFCGLLGIHSPSTVFEGYGVNLIEGLAQGASGSFGLISDAFTGIFGGMKDGISKSFNGVTKFFSGLLTKVKDACTKIKNTTIPQPKAVWKEVQKKTSGVIDKIKDSVKKFKATLPDPKITWKTVQDKANNVIKTIKNKVTKFSANLPKPKISWGDITTTVKNSIDKIKKIVTGFSWSLPKPKLPRFSVTGGEAPWGFMGKGSMPKISIKWYKTGGIMMGPTIFGSAGNSLLGGGEAGPEAILPLDQFWRQLSNQFQQQNMILRNAAMSNNSGNNRPVNITLKVNDIEMGRAVIDSLQALSKHGGNIDLPL